MGFARAGGGSGRSRTSVLARWLVLRPGSRRGWGRLEPLGLWAAASPFGRDLGLWTHFGLRPGAGSRWGGRTDRKTS